MSAVEFVSRLRRLGITLEPIGEQIRVRGPVGAVTDEHRQIIRFHRPELLTFLLQTTGAVSLPPTESPVTAEPIFIDLETRSACDLRKFGGRIYARHHTTEMLSVVALIDNLIIVWFPLRNTVPPAEVMRPSDCPADLAMAVFGGQALPAPLADAVRDGRPLCAHNASEFDRPVWESRGWPEPSSWVDTLHIARAAGLPGKLDLLGQRLLGSGKDQEGERVLKALCKPNRQGLYRPISEEAAVALGRYNVRDVLICREVFRRYHGCEEPDVLAMDQTINSRGMAFDRELANALIRIAGKSILETCQRVEHETSGAIKGSDLLRTGFILKWLRTRGLAVNNLQRETVERHLERSDLPADVRAVLEGRIAATRKSTNKLETALLRVDSDERLRHMFVYYKAHTGRWAGRGVQPQNLPRPKKALGDVTRLISPAICQESIHVRLRCGVSVEDTISALIRPCFRAADGKVLIIADFAAIEARGVAWCAGDVALTAQFANGVDVYSQFASQLFGRPVTKSNERERERAIGKVAVLACGYSMGAEKFGEKCRKDKVDLAAVGLTAAQAIEGYRDAYPAIAGQKVAECGREYRTGGLWRNLERAAREAIETGIPQSVAYCTLERAGSDLVIHLPSGRPMFFRNARIEQKVPGYAARLGLPPTLKPTLVYTNTKNLDEDLYGGKITENVVSGICRDLQVAAMLGLERAGLPIVLHVHDEIVVEAPEAHADEALQRMLRIMSSPPSWAAGFPIEAEGFCSARYVKSPPLGSVSRSARNGQMLNR